MPPLGDIYRRLRARASSTKFQAFSQVRAPAVFQPCKQGLASVRVGVPSGQVKHIELWRDNPGFVRVRIEVKSETPILQGTTASLQGSFTGPSSILLDGAVKGAPPIADVGPAGAPVIPTKRSGLGALLNNAPQLLERISTLTERPGIAT